MDYETLLLERAGGAIWITLNRPQALNAFTAQMNGELRRALLSATKEPNCRLVVITGAGRAFCAGQDLQARRQGFLEGQAPHLRDSLVQNYNPLVRAMRAAPQPILAAVNGVAAGAGMSLALACDLRFAVDEATFIQSFVRVGLTQDSGSSYTLPRLVGFGRASWLALSGEPLAAAAAEAIGLVNRVVPKDELVPAVRALADKLSALPAGVVAMTKRGLHRALELDLVRALEYEAWLQEIAGRGVSSTALRDRGGFLPGQADG